MLILYDIKEFVWRIMKAELNQSYALLKKIVKIETFTLCLSCTLPLLSPKSVRHLTHFIFHAKRTL